MNHFARNYQSVHKYLWKRGSHLNRRASMLSLLVMALLVGITRASGTGLKAAGIMRNTDGSHVIQFHSNPNAYLGWKVYEVDKTIWWTLNCQKNRAHSYCAFGVTKPGLKPEKMHNMFNSDIFTAMKDTVQDRFGDSEYSQPSLDKHQDIECSHCGIHDNGELHVIFFRNLTTGDPHDVDITNQTYRIIWAIGPLDKTGDIQYHTYKPTKDYQYKYINFLAPELTEVPEFKDRVKKVSSKGGADACRASLVALLLWPVVAALLRR